MKKLMFLIFLLFIPFIVNAEVKISEAVLVDNTEGLEVEEHPQFEGLQLEIDMKLAEVGEYAKYKLTINNDTKKDYEINMGEAFSAKEYIKYEFSFVDDDNSVLKANENKDIYVTVTYNKEVPENEFVDGVYKDDNVMTINLSTEEQQQVNPDTKTGYIVFGIAIILIISVAILLLTKHKLNKAMVLIIATAIIIPMSIFALEKITITIKAKIQIVYKTPQFCVAVDEAGEDIKYYDYAKGFTWAEYLVSDFNRDYFRTESNNYIYPYEYIPGYCGLQLMIEDGKAILEDKIIDSKNGCYFVNLAPC